MKSDKILAHIWTLPRWFAVPAAASAVALGCILTDAEGWLTAIAIICGAFLMAWAHSMNTLLDYSWIGLDLGLPETRSKPKEYSSGSQVIARGIMGPKEVFANALGWLIISAGLAVVIHLEASAWVWLPWGLVACMTFWYSQAKKYWHPEVPLCLGFATFAIWLGMATTGKPDFGLGALASLPLILIWALAEHVDQAIDYEPNWPRGGRSIGMLAVHFNIPLRWSIMWFMCIVYLLQVFLISIGILSQWTGLTFITLIPATVCIVIIDKTLKNGLLWGLGAIFLYQTLLVVGQCL